MKKFTIMALALCLTFVMAAPVMAVDADFSGTYRVRGVYVSHWDLDETSASNAFMNMRFRLKTVFKVSDILSVTTRFDALDDYMWGGGNNRAGGGNAGNLNFDRAYMTIKAPIGTFTIGRQPVGTFGTKFVDSGTQGDRIKYTKVVDNLTIIALFEKAAEEDAATGTADESDMDKDGYVLAAIYKAENATVGVLASFTNDKTISNSDTKSYGLNPYFVSKFGPIGIQGEAKYVWGQTEYDDNSTDLDIKKLAYNVEASFNLGAASIIAGYAFISGDDGVADNENSAFGSIGNDWERLFILTTDEVPLLDNSLGGINNLAAGVDFGAKIIYGGVNVTPIENLTLGFVVGSAKADKITSVMTKDDYGMEYDFTLNWKIYDNLTYSAVVAFLSAGDIWWNASTATKPSTFDDTYALFHQLQLSF